MYNQLLSPNMPFVEFPQGWAIKFLEGAERKPIHYLVKRKESPNVVSVAFFGRPNDPHDKQYDLWEIAVAEEHSNGQIGIKGYEAMVPLNDVEGLLHFIEKMFDEDVQSVEVDNIDEY